MTFVIFVFTFVLAALALAMYAWLLVHSKWFEKRRIALQRRSQWWDDLLECHWCTALRLNLILTPVTNLGMCLVGVAPWWSLATLPLTIPAVAFAAARTLDQVR